MKKVLGIITTIFLLSMSAGQSNAATLESWNYTLSDIKLSEINTDFGYKYSSVHHKEDGMTYKSGDNWHSLEAKQITDIIGQDSVANSGISNVGNNDSLLRYDTSTYNSGVISNTSTKIANLSFTYSANPEGSNMGLSMTYTLPLYSYYDAATSTSYVYFADNEVSSTGKNTLMAGGNLYIALGFNLYVDGKALSQKTDANGVTYSGWAINNYTKENNDAGIKEWQGSFDITSEFVMLNYPLTTGAALEQPTFKATYINQNATAPTPEPATMLLMGIGLAALGFRVRNKNK